MQINTPYNAYSHAAETLNSSEQIIMLYDAAINYVKQAKEAIKENDQDTRYQLINKAMSILRGLRLCLDFSACEEIAAAMDRYYDALDKLMISVQCHQDQTLCDAIIENLRTIKNTWQEINLHMYDSKEGNTDESGEIANSNLLI